ncbi:hypothetical protein F3Y22_tig00111543pilonHSYRG00022 [Hibiscus syriacus]|uniref:Uncharacterized protein n=1 Tax=Hibiscus syriacus TaxID=106335 RepID=A0A6A2XNI9_HIBSY|nr:hypothetical protein F3Y22_tig00111543pilonHSYRG00022 [Hibiscus syriacus]
MLRRWGRAAVKLRSGVGMDAALVEKLLGFMEACVFRLQQTRVVSSRFTFQQILVAQNRYLRVLLFPRPTFTHADYGVILVRASLMPEYLRETLIRSKIEWAIFQKRISDADLAYIAQLANAKG